MKPTNIKRKRILRNMIFITSILCFLLIVRIGVIQFVQGSELQSMAYSQQTLNRKINPKRGTIYDSTGKNVLAVSASVETVSVTPKNIAPQNKEKLAKKMAEIFDLNYENVLKKVSKRSSIETIVKKVDKEKTNELRVWLDENNIVTGVNIDEDTKRYYPYGTLASNVIGFTGSDNQGLEGIESRYDSILKGEQGKILKLTDATGSELGTAGEDYVEAVNGDDLILSIDMTIQAIAEKYLENACIDNICTDGGNIVIMNPKTGDVLAMATYPDYNLNTPFEPNETLSSTWDSLSKTAQSEALQKMWRNTAVSNTYEPGSVFKVVVASAALEENIVETDTPAIFYCSGVQEVADRKIHCANAAGHGYQSLRQALQNSCNPAFIQLGQKIGVDTLYKYFKSFGLFTKTGIATAGEATGIFHDKDSVGPVELATISFGQRFTITPLQMITAISAVANDGYLMQPRIVKEITNYIIIISLE